MIQPRDPERTRETLLEAAFEEIHAQGFRAASLDNILRRTGVTKGALYHHFPSKAALGYAVVDEVIFPIAAENWAQLTEDSGNPLDLIQEFIRGLLEETSTDRLSLGCPINNLVQEMAGIDEGFRERLQRIQSAWREALGTALTNGQRRGLVKGEVEPERAAAFLVAAYEGCVGVAKCAQSKELFARCLRGMSDYVETLRPTSGTS